MDTQVLPICELSLLPSPGSLVIFMGSSGPVPLLDIHKNSPLEPTLPLYEIATLPLDFIAQV